MLTARDNGPPTFMKTALSLFFMACWWAGVAHAQAAKAAPGASATTAGPNLKDDGYRGIWFTLGQKAEYGDKYSGGLGTYTANHARIAKTVESVDLIRAHRVGSMASRA